MINEVRKGITDAIYAAFGDNCEIHTEASMQDMTEPAFFVRCISPSLPTQITGRRKATLLFSIQYFAESAKPNQEINDVFEKLVECLELIEADGKRIRGEVECKDISDGVLTADAEYTLFLTKQEAETCMEEYEMKGVIEDGSSQRD